MLSGASLGTCDVPSVRGAASCFSGGTDLAWCSRPRGFVVDNRWRGSARLGSALGHVRGSGGSTEPLTHLL